MCLFDRVAWVLVWLAALAFCVYLFIIKLQQLTSCPTNIDLNYEFKDTLPFPAVTICNLNPYRLVVCLIVTRYHIFVNMFCDIGH